MKKLLFFFLIIVIASILRLWGINWSDVYEDEAHYINDGLRLHNRDPYMSLRYHTYHHPEPSIGHPMLVQLFSSLNYYFFQPSVVSARLPSAFAGIILVEIIFFFNKSLGSNVSKFAALFIAIAPIMVRYNRNAMLDSIFSVVLTAIALVIWRYLNSPNRYLLLFAGVLAGLAMSTKLDGLFGVLLIILSLIFCSTHKINRAYFVGKAMDLIFIFLPFLIVFLFFNDPNAYIDGIKNPTFTGWDFTSLAFWKDRISAKSVISLFNVSLDLLGPAFVIFYIWAVVKLLPSLRDRTIRFLTLWTLSVGGVLFIHGFTVDSSYGWLTWIPPVALTLSYLLSGIAIRYKRLVVFLIILLTLPFTFIYGWRFERLPQHGIEYNIVYNRLRTDNFYQGVIRDVNTLSPHRAKVLLLPQMYYPIFALRPDISWSYTDSKIYDFYVLDHLIDDPDFYLNNKYVGSVDGYQDGIYVQRFYFMRSDL